MYRYICDTFSLSNRVLSFCESDFVPFALHPVLSVGDPVCAPSVDRFAIDVASIAGPCCAHHFVEDGGRGDVRLLERGVAEGDV